MRATAAAVLVGLAAPALAGLGEGAASLEQDAAHFGASREETRHAGYAVVTLDTPGGVRIKAWVAPPAASGRVVAVSWAGPAMPDLARLLASHYPTFTEYAARPPSHRNAVRIDTPGLVLESAGRLRAYRGRAYCPDLLPAGLGAQDIQ